LQRQTPRHEYFERGGNNGGGNQKQIPKDEHLRQVSKLTSVRSSFSNPFRRKLWDDNPDGVLILKTCIGGAFYNKYVKATYKHED